MELRGPPGVSLKDTYTTISLMPTRTPLTRLPLQQQQGPPQISIQEAPRVFKQLEMLQAGPPPLDLLQQQALNKQEACCLQQQEREQQGGGPLGVSVLPNNTQLLQRLLLLQQDRGYLLFIARIFRLQQRQQEALILRAPSLAAARRPRDSLRAATITPN